MSVHPHVEHAAAFRKGELVLCVKGTDYFQRGEVTEVLEKAQAGMTGLTVRIYLGSARALVSASNFVRLTPGMVLPLEPRKLCPTCKDTGVVPMPCPEKLPNCETDHHKKCTSCSSWDI